MVDIASPRQAAPAPQGNAIVTPHTTALDFPALALGAVVVGTGIYLISEESDHAAWILTILLLLAIAYAQRSFGSEISSLLSGQPHGTGGPHLQ